MKRLTSYLAVIVLVVILFTPLLSAVSTYSKTTTPITPLSPTNTNTNSTTTTTTVPAKKTTTTTHTTAPVHRKKASTGGNVVGSIENILRGGGHGNKSFYVVGSAIVLVLVLYIWFTPFGRKRRSKASAYAKYAELAPPKGYDLIGMMVDATSRDISKDKFIKLSENLYLSTSVTRPTFLYVPGHVEPYMCKEGRSIVPCFLGFRKGLLSIVVDPELAASHDMAVQAGIISVSDKELDKLLSELYKKEEKKLGEVKISSDTRIGFAFNLSNMIKGYLGILRAADDMMIHFLNTASEAESIEKFMKTAARMAGAKLTWLKWVAYLIMAMAIAVAMLMVLGGK